MSPTSRVRAFCSSAILVLALGVPFAVAADDTAAKTVPAATVLDTSAIGIDNFGRVSATYFRGSQPKGADYEALAKLGVKTIINLTSDDAQPTERVDSEMAGMRYVELPMNTRVPPTAAQLTEFLSVVNDPASQPVYVHCVGGRHRTGVMTAAYRMTNEGWTPEQAFTEMKQYKYGADFLHPEFKAFVYGFKPPTASMTPTPVDFLAPAVLSPVSAQEPDAAIR